MIPVVNAAKDLYANGNYPCIPEYYFNFIFIFS
jgi:hypothetical protein